MPEAQKEIYYLTGESRVQVENAPVLEGFRASGFEVLLLTDPIDELVLPSFPEYKGKPLRAVDRADVDAAPEGSKPTDEEEAAFRPLLARLGEHLPSVKEVRLSRRLTESAACLVAAEGEMGAHLERLLAHSGHSEGLEGGKRVLELNARHPLVAALRDLHAARPDDPRVELYGGLLYEEALLSEGGRLADPASFARRVNEVLLRDAEAAAPRVSSSAGVDS
jgi:molecular chaperone HtpG